MEPLLRTRVFTTSLCLTLGRAASIAALLGISGFFSSTLLVAADSADALPSSGGVANEPCAEAATGRGEHIKVYHEKGRFGG